MSELKQILIVNDFGFVNGGATRVALESAHDLVARGFDVTFFSGVGSLEESSGTSALKMVSCNHSEFPKDPIKIRGAARSIWSPSIRRKLEEVLETLDPERTIVHVHTWVLANSASIFAPLIRRKFRYVITLHDYFIACPNGAFTVFPKAETCSAKPLSWDCLTTNCDAKSVIHKAFKFGRQWVQKKFGKIPDGAKNFIFVSEFSRRILEPHLPSTASFFDLPNPIHLRKSKPAEVRENRGWAYVGRLSPEKGCRIFAEAAARLKLEASFFGEGEEAAAIREIYPEAHLRGWLNDEELASAMLRVRGLVFPSIYLETQGLSTSEALALGLPVIVSSDTAAAALIVPNETGLVFRRNDVSDLVAKIRRLDEDPELRAKIGRQAFEKYWSSPATLEKHVDRLMEIYQAVQQ